MIKKSQFGLSIFGLLLIGSIYSCHSQQSSEISTQITTVGDGWAQNSVNAVIFRKNSLVTENGTQYIAWYDTEGHVMLGKCVLGAQEWQVRQTRYSGNTRDAHRSISIMVDGDGYLHVAWDHHNSKLRYCRSKSPGSLELTDEMPMTGQAETSISYPEFYRLPNGNLLFFYRDGASGRGNLVIDRYNLETRTWTQLHDNLISGEGQRNAYWQACVGHQGNIQISWVWRETPDVASNHDLGYALSRDGGVTWERSNGEQYTLPITEATTEYAAKIPQNSELINQTSMATDTDGNPFIATYWRDAGDSIPQFHLVYQRTRRWEIRNLGFRHTVFSLSGLGTKRIPISRSQIVVSGRNSNSHAWIIFRDEERGNTVSIAGNTNPEFTDWKVLDLASGDYGSWEPTYDTELWKQSGILSLFLQRVVQVDNEGIADVPAQPVRVLNWQPALTTDR